MVHKDAIVGRPSKIERTGEGRGLESGRPGFVPPLGEDGWPMSLGDDDSGDY